MPPLVQAALLGVVQGLTEFLPISSTAHLLIAEKLIGYQDPGGIFAVMIQLGSVLAVVWLYRSTFLDVLFGLTSRADARRFALMILVAVLPSLVAGAFLADFIKTVLYGSFAVIAASFVLGGVAILAIERLRPVPVVTSAMQTPLGRALAIGGCQTLALVPGVSRSGATIMGAVALGLDRRAAAEFSFFLAVPTMTAAFAHDFYEVRSQLTPERSLEIAVGFVLAFVAAALVVRPFLSFVGRSGFAPFAWYRIAAGAAIAAALVAGVL
jgi:undecaprenyl-diphosphatase